MKQKLQPEITAAIVASLISGIFGLGNAYFAWWLQQNNAQQIQTNAQQIKNLNQEVFKPRIIIESPDKDTETGWILPLVKGTVLGEIKSDYKILVGHRGITEQEIKIHIDRSSEILSDKSFMVDKIYLGSEKKGIGEKFEIIVLLVSENTLDSLDLKGDDKPMKYIPEYIAKSVTRVTRVK